MQITSIFTGFLLGAVVLAAPLTELTEGIEATEPVAGSVNTAEDNTGGTGFTTSGFGIHNRQRDKTREHAEPGFGNLV
ncbi:hypothetical protein PG994_004961 [Apiospora phragmitis]|uniref:Uncharacterized protein n=1 Tax=Apiospora phragmitis TaxID=2905665 RepID=A0ABR1VTB5_9PEZI